MNRADFAWALSAVLPHVGKLEQYDVLGLANHAGQFYAYATDGYTIGVARLPELATLPALCLSGREATELLRFVRPERVPERSESVEWAVKGDEFHVAIKSESAVFNCITSNLSAHFLLRYMENVYARPFEARSSVYDPELFARFAKARREKLDRMHVYPREDKKRGLAIVTVGADFIGAVAGINYSHAESSTIESFLGESEYAA